MPVSIRPLVCLLALVVTRTGTTAEPPRFGSVRTLNLPAEPFNYSELDLPRHVADVAAKWDNTPTDNAITDDGATLGRVLFYDVALSASGTLSCASCHHQELGFTDGEVTSVGQLGDAVRRNSMPLVNLRFYPGGKMFWDERATSIEDQVLQPIEDPAEMGHDLDELTRQLRADPIYPPLFDAAFGSPDVSSDRIAKSLAQFIRAIVSFDSAYDRGLAQVDSVLDPFPNFNHQQNYGKRIFFGRGRCAECHLPDDGANDRRQSAFFHLQTPVNNGIDSSSAGDRGVAEVSGDPGDGGKFKSSSLRNIELTGPYMHDGRFHTIDQVIEHYNWSVKPVANLDERLQGFAHHGASLPEVEKVALAEFLLTLTDDSVLSDERFSDPFVGSKVTP